eukprot:1013810_1
MQGDHITKASVRNLYEQNEIPISNESIIQLVNVLGGMDTILAQYLSASCNIPITQSQLRQIKRAIQMQYQGQNTIQTLTEMTPNHHNIETNTSRSGDITYYFNESDTLLHYLISGDTANRILRILYSKMIKLFVLLFCVYHAVLLTISTATGPLFFNHMIPSIISLSISFMFTIPWMTFVVLSANRKALWLILQTFEFWFKFVNGITNSIGVIVLQSLNHAHLLDVLFVSVSQMMLLQTIFCISILDALGNLNKRWEISFSVLMAALFVVACVQDLITIYDTTEDLHFENLWIMKFSLESVIVNSRRNVMLFFVKQAVLCVLRRNKDRAVMIKYTPIIKWSTEIHNTHRDQMINSDVTMASTGNEIETSMSIDKEVVVNCAIRSQMEGNGGHSSDSNHSIESNENANGRS